MVVESVQAYRMSTRVKQLPVQTLSDGVQFCFLEDVEDAFGIEGPCQFEVENLAVMYLRDANHQRYNPKRLPVFPDKIIDIVHCTAFTTQGARSSPNATAAQDVAKGGSSTDMNSMIQITPWTSLPIRPSTKRLLGNYLP
ncbi:unnamed protein product [Mortierella alpina]